MGAWMTSQTGIGKTPAEAYRNAVAAAEAEYGHQQGYSGAINSGGHGFIVVDLPARMTYAKFQALLEDAEEVAEVEWRRDDIRFAQREVDEKRRGAKGRLATAKRNLAKAEKQAERFAAKVERAGFSRYDFARLAESYNDKWGEYLAVELRGAEKARYLGGRKLRRGERLYVFFGYAPS